MNTALLAQTNPYIINLFGSAFLHCQHQSAFKHDTPWWWWYILSYFYLIWKQNQPSSANSEEMNIWGFWWAFLTLEQTTFLFLRSSIKVLLLTSNQTDTELCSRSNARCSLTVPELKPVCGRDDRLPEGMLKREWFISRRTKTIFNSCPAKCHVLRIHASTHTWWNT